MIPQNRQFPSTRWSRILNAADKNGVADRATMGELMEAYWYPVYTYFRRMGRPHSEAENLTQDFFADAFQNRVVHRAKAPRERREGAFRRFLKECLRNFAIDDYRARMAEKRDGGQRLVEFDGAAAESRYSLDRSRNSNWDRLTPEQVFDRNYALEVLNGAIEELAEEAAQEGKGPIFHAVRDFVTGDTKPAGYEGIAAHLSVPVGTLKSHVYRFKERYRELIRERVAETLDRPGRAADVDDELSELGNAL